MKPIVPFALTSAVFMLGAVVSGQQRHDVVGPTSPKPAETPVDAAEAPRVRPLDNSRTRIHTAPDDPEGGRYGVWGAGATYKASFHDRFTFVPYLGGGYPHNQPLTWRTVSATVGDQPVARIDGEPLRRQEDFRYEYRWGEFVEAYEVLVEGAEQTFTLESRPAFKGDFEVTGEVTTRMEAEPVFDEHTRVTFFDQQGNALVHYGEAFALDALGRRTDVFTSYDGRLLYLRVPESWLATAAYPVTIDPFLTRECVAFWSSAGQPNGEVLTTDIGRDDLENNLMIAFTRQASATDEDLEVWLFTSDTALFSTRHLIFTDMTTSWGISSPAVAFGSRPALDWIIAFIRLRIAGTQNGARYHVHDHMDTSLSTSFSVISRPAGSSHGEVIDVGGVLLFTSKVFVVYERDDLGSNRDVFGIPIDLNGNIQGAEVLIDVTAAGTEWTRRRPSINQVGERLSVTDGWVVAYEEYWDAKPGGGDDWDIELRRVDGTGALTGNVSSPSSSMPDDRHKLTPVIEGSVGRYSLGLVTWAEGPTLTKTSTRVGTEIWNQRFDWDVAAPTPTNLGLCQLTDGLANDQRWAVTSVGADIRTADHWAFAFEDTVLGIVYGCSTGFDGGRIERVVAYDPPGSARAFSGAVMFNDDWNLFHFSYATDESAAACGGSSATNHTVYCQRYDHLRGPREVFYGVACGPGTIGALGRSYTGTEDYFITLSGAPANAPAWILLSLGPDNIPLDPLMMPGCSMNLSRTLLIFTFLVFTDANGDAQFHFPLFTCPFLLCGDLYFQWAHLSPGLNPIGIAATQGMHVRIWCP